MASESAAPDAPKKKARAFAPGSNVKVKIGTEIRGPIYLVQIVDGKATLQDSETHVVPVEDLRPLD